MQRLVEINNAAILDNHDQIGIIRHNILQARQQRLGYIDPAVYN